ncbi:MAG: hypothetical protein EXS18_00555 [Verrucomicrobiae bacterium]|nr:hypothetical protein [Verrucomicrobiae bacterium]
MYLWRQLTDRQRQDLLTWRRNHDRPWHSPPHWHTAHTHFHVSAACYEHQCIPGKHTTRMQEFEDQLLRSLQAHDDSVIAWCLLPNHYHALVKCNSIQSIRRDLGVLHGQLSWKWNGEDNQRGRKVWFNCLDKPIRGDRHFWTTVNYIHNNPVRHGYVKRWQDWPFSSAASFLEKMGRKEAERIWREFPILEYGKGWDDANL